MNHKLYNPCKYSFKDLIKAAGKKNDILITIYSLPQTQKNAVVKELCYIANWYYEDVETENGETYTAFSPDIVEI